MTARLVRHHGDADLRDFGVRIFASCGSSASAVPLSLTLPLRSEPFEARGLLPFFENLLPEGWLLELSTAKLKIPKDDAFGLLLATCADCVGAVEIGT